jgi:hypothetical protein
MATTKHDRDQDLLEGTARYRVLVDQLPAGWVMVDREVADD